MVNLGGVVGSVVFCCCGPKGSMCCLALSVWGVIMLACLGAFYKIEAVALFEDVAGAAPHYIGNESTDFPLPGVHYYLAEDISKAYSDASTACFGAAAIYLFFFLLSGAFIFINMWRSKIKQT